MKSLSQNKPVVVAILLFAVVIIAYNFFFAGRPGSVATESATAQSVGNDVVALNNDLQSVTLDTTIFKSNIYTSLMNFTPQIPAEPIGRLNPFAPLGQ